MSINHFSSDLPETLWWQQQQQQHQSTMEPIQNIISSSKQHKAPNNLPQDSPFTSHLYGQQSPCWMNPRSYNSEESSSMIHTQNPTLNFNLNEGDNEEDVVEVQSLVNNIEEEQEAQHIEKLENEPMFEKPLTPSDVGKLNRLVIPKQHAEKYFPLGGTDSGHEKGLLLSFEDESGKCWRFRYSYWNSSQSYVLTKGWSRYVKEKRLDAGDIVLFARHRDDSDRLFIGWRRRRGGGAGGGGGTAGGGGGGSGEWSNGLYPGHPYPPSGHIQGHGVTVPYQPDCLHAGVAQNQTTSGGSSKTLRLFGVNLECQLDASESEPSTPDGPSLSSQDRAHYQHHLYSQAYSSSSSPTKFQSHMVTHNSNLL